MYSFQGRHRLAIHRSMNSQEDFGSLGIPDEEDHGVLLHIVEHPSLSRKNSEKSLEDLEFRSSETRESTDDALDELFDLFSKCGVVSTTPVMLFNGQSMDAATWMEDEDNRLPLQPPRRFPRRIWIALVKRMLRVHGLSTATSSGMELCEY
jgi:hypothetical protein